MALADLIDARREEIVARWCDRVRRELPRDVEMTQLQDAMPEYLTRLAGALRTADPLTQKGSAIWEEVAREHAVTRVRLGFDVGELVREFILLRQVLYEISLQDETTLPVGRQATRVTDLMKDVADLIESAICVAVGTYVEARDYAARQKEAEHISFLTHELRNPLSTMKLTASRLRGVVPQESAHTLELLERNAERLDALIESVLHAERLESGKVTARVAEIELGELLDGPVETARIAAEAKGLAFRAQYDGRLLVRADHELAASAVRNLLDNAVKYTDAGEVRIEAEPAADRATLHVFDNCPGLSEEELRIVFEPFERGRTKGKPGTGLGLAIAQRAIEAQGGTIGAESRGERGCHFWITLPRSLH